LLVIQYGDVIGEETSSIFAIVRKSAVSTVQSLMLTLTINPNPTSHNSLGLSD